MLTEGKVWGETSLLFETPTVQVHHLSIRQGGYCSQHFHSWKRTKMIVLKGSLVMTIFRTDGMEDRTILTKGAEMIIDHLVTHKFAAVEETEAIEIYDIALREPDISRQTVGGKGGAEFARALRHPEAD